MHLETDAVASFILKNLGDRCFVGGRPGLTLNAWKSWKESEKGWFLSHHASYPLRERTFRGSASGNATFWRFAALSFPLLTRLPRPGRSSPIRDVATRFPTASPSPSKTTRESSSREGEFGDCSLVYWFGERVGFKGIGCGPAPNRLGKGWRTCSTFGRTAWSGVEDHRRGHAHLLRCGLEAGEGRSRNQAHCGEQLEPPEKRPPRHLSRARERARRALCPYQTPTGPEADKRASGKRHPC